MAEIINLRAKRKEAARAAARAQGDANAAKFGRNKAARQFEHARAEKSARDLADGINALMRDEPKRHAMALAGRQRAVEHFSWKSIARKTMALYKTLAG